jgi:D-serine deaminase-like pyridoxal phosphate-dependent protein
MIEISRRQPANVRIARELGTAIVTGAIEPGALLLSRVVSVHPDQGTFTLDAGHKAVAADPAGVRGILFDRPGYAEPVFQNEEHWVWKVSNGQLPNVGDEFRIQPTHICPTVALHHSAHVLDANGRWKGDWVITGRNRDLPF